MSKLMIVPKSLEKVNQCIALIMKAALAVNLTVMVGIVFYAVISRNVLHASIAWAEELSRILFLWLVFSGAVLGLHYREHLGLTILVDRFNPRWKLIFEIVSWALIIVVTRAMINGGHRIVEVVHSARTPALGLPTSIKYWPVLVAGYAMILISIENLLFRTADLVKGWRHKS